MQALTERQTAILDWIVAFIDEHRIPPTVREIAREFGISPPGAQGHLKRMEAKGVLRRGDLGARSLEVTTAHCREEGDVVSLPAVGRIAAGTPLLADENVERMLAVDRMLLGSGGTGHFALKVVGDSMIEAGIHDGDYVVVRRQSTARNGDIVVALIDEEATLKRFYREKNRIRLQPANSTMKPIYVKEVAIQGVVTGALRVLS